MVSSLAAQLLQQASVNSEVLNSQSRRRHYAYSFLFSEQEAGQHDLDSIYGLGHNGYVALSALDPSITKSGDVLFSEAARSLDRTVIPFKEATELKTNIARFLRRISRHFLLNPTGKIIEWLVRRFRINEFDVDEVISAFLPFHDSSHFSRMLSILNIQPNTPWAFLLRFKKAGVQVSRSSITSQMVKDSDLARLVTSVLPSAIEENNLYPALVNFNTSVTVEYIMQLTRIDEGLLAFTLPAITSSLVLRGNKEAMLGSFVILGSLSRKVQLKPKVIEAVTTVMINALSQVEEHQLLAALIAF
ncbi:snoRNA-binding rRNA-processing protein utp10, partial [Tulasnella sp. 419]